MDGYDLLSEQLQQLSLSIPEVGTFKTEIVAPKQPAPFLGREIVHLDGEGRYVGRVGRAQIERICENLRTEFNAERYVSDGKNLSDLLMDLTRSASSYVGAYRDAHNCAHVENEIRAAVRMTTNNVFVDLFGQDLLTVLDERQRRFLGLRDKIVLSQTEIGDLAEL